MPLCYEENFKVYQFECDPWDNMTPGAALRRIQEIGTAQCEKIGLNEEHYLKTGTVFLLSRISLQMPCPPTIQQNVRIQTRAYGMHRAVYQRVTSMYGEDGTLLCEADSRWLLVDRNTHRILRKELEGFNSPFVEQPGAEGHEMEMPKPGELQDMGSYTAGYTLCDRNGHINNTRYADLVCDALPLEQLRQHPLRKMLLFYRSEIAMGQQFEIGRCAPQENGYYFLVQADGRKSFEGYAEF